MKNFQNEEKWNITFTLDQEIKQLRKYCDTNKTRNIENYLLALASHNPKRLHEFQSKLITVNQQNKSLSFNLNTIMEIFLEGLEAKNEIPLIPFISQQSISNMSLIKSDMYEGTYNNKNILLVEKKEFPHKINNPLLFDDYNSYYFLRNLVFPKLIGQTCLEKTFMIIDKPQGRTLLDLFDMEQMHPNMLSSFDNYKLIIALKIIEAVEDIHNSKKILAYLNPESITVSSNFDIFFTGIYNTANTSSVYSSPSLLLSENEIINDIDFSADIWSLGCLIYFIFSGHHPFDNDREKAIKQIKNKNNFLSDDIKINSKIKEVVKMCCNLKTQEKITSVHSLKLFFIISHQSFFKINFKGILDKKGEKFDEVLGFYKPVIKIIFSYLTHNQLTEIQNRIYNKKVYKAVYDLQNRYKSVSVKSYSSFTETKPIYSLSHFIEKDKDIIIVAGADTSIKLYNMMNKKIINKLASDSTTYLVLRYSLYSKEYLLSYCREKVLKIFDLRLRELVRVIKINEPNISSIVMLEIDIIAYTSEKNIYIFNLLESKVTSTLVEHFNSVKCLAHLNNYDKNLLASGSWDSTVKIWNLSTGVCLKTFYAHKGSVISIIHLFQYSKELVASSSTRESSIKIWNFNTLEIFMNLTGHSGPVLSLLYLNTLHPSLICSCANEDVNSIKIWDLDKKESIATLQGQETTIKSMIFVKNSRGYFNLITASEDYSVRMWEFEENFTNK